METTDKQQLDGLLGLDTVENVQIVYVKSRPVIIANNSINNFVCLPSFSNGNSD